MGIGFDYLLILISGSNFSLCIVPLSIIALLPSFFLSSLTGGPFSAEPSQSGMEISILITSIFSCSSLIVPFFLKHVMTAYSDSATMYCFTSVALFLSCGFIYHAVYNDPESNDDF